MNTGIPISGLIDDSYTFASERGSGTSWFNVTWNAVAGATSYEIWRHTSGDSSAATLLNASVTEPTYDDYVDAGTAYWYWVKAKNAATGVIQKGGKQLTGPAA